MKKGFTLIELLAVIVILAIIALIATPIILNIINDAKQESQERSIELYASAIKNGIAAYQLREGKEVAAGSYTTDSLPLTVEYEGDVECDTIELYEDGSIYLANCKVNDTLVEDYTYGTKETACTIKRQAAGKYSVGDVVTCVLSKSTEQFYVIENEEEDTTEGIDMLAMYNLNIGDMKNSNELTHGLQDKTLVGDANGEFSGTTSFATEEYWGNLSDDGTHFIYTVDSNYAAEGRSYAYVYGNYEQNLIYTYVEEYVSYLNTKLTNSTGKLLSYNEAIRLGCLNSSEPYTTPSSCASAPIWLYSTSYWLGSNYDYQNFWYIFTDGNIKVDGYLRGLYGVRPVITISTSNIQ